MKPITRHLSILALTTYSLPLVAAPGDHSHEEVHDLDPLVVDATIAPRNSRDMLNPTTVVTARELDRVRSTSLGATLDGQPGVHATAFGAGASRPVIRGMEGVRLKVLESGVDSGDLSADSPDHATAIEPFFIDRVEVLRGASTLLFGSSAIGGAVNVIDKRVPRTMPEAASAEGFVSYDSASEGWTYGALVELPLERIAISASYLERDHEDYEIPGMAELEEAYHDEDDHDDHHEDEHEEEIVGLLENSFVEASTASLGVSWFPSKDTRVTVAWQTTESLYGVPGHAHAHEAGHEEEEHGEEGHEDDEHGHGEEGVAIDMDQSMLDLELEHRVDSNWLKSIEGRIRLVDYEHQELEGDEVGTDFDKETLEARLIATYAFESEDPGAFGIQWSDLDSKAVGEESLTPESQTRDLALFLIQEWTFEDFRVEGGLRMEHRDLDAEGTAGYDAWAQSASIGSRWTASDELSLGILLNLSGRHPTATELFADGPHAATRQFEIGNAGLDAEAAQGIDLSLQYQNPILSFGLTAFVTDFSDYIFASPTGDEEDGLPIFVYAQVDAQFMGLEAQSTWHVWHEGDTWFDIGFLADMVDTDIENSSGELPRIPPARIGIRLDYVTGPWRIHTRLLRSLKQDDTALNELPTAAYTNWTASLSFDLPTQNGNWRFTLAGENLLDEEIRVHTSPIKDLAPSPGRTVRATISAAF
jgi:iron complex outermembrane receptor protein